MGQDKTDKIVLFPIYVLEYTIDYDDYSWANDNQGKPDHYHEEKKFGYETFADFIQGYAEYLQLETKVQKGSVKAYKVIYNEIDLSKINELQK